MRTESLHRRFPAIGRLSDAASRRRVPLKPSPPSPGVAQGELEGGEGMAMDAYPLGQEHARWTREHVSLPSSAGVAVARPRSAAAVRAAEPDCLRGSIGNTRSGLPTYPRSAGI